MLSVYSEMTKVSSQVFLKRCYLRFIFYGFSWFIYVTENNSSYAAASYASTFVQQTNSSHTTFGGYCSHLMNVSDTTNIKVRFDVGTYDSSVSFNGDQNANLTYAVFTRIGETY